MLRCFPLAKVASHHESHPILDWIDMFSGDVSELTEKQKAGLSKLIPLLLCGEQSAVFVFQRESKRVSNESIKHALEKIEADENLHEKALQLLLMSLPTNESHRTKRLAQRFYARIEKRTNTIAEHFMAISELDACVCILMHTVANSSIKHTNISKLFQLIKLDEARHVNIARNYAENLSLEVSHNRYSINSELVELLKQEQGGFTQLGINTEELFKRLLDLKK